MPEGRRRDSMRERVGKGKRVGMTECEGEIEELRNSSGKANAYVF